MTELDERGSHIRLPDQLSEVEPSHCIIRPAPKETHIWGSAAGGSLAQFRRSGIEEEIGDGSGDHKLRAAEIIFLTMPSSWLAIESFLDGAA